jgi:hypothetical protein
MYSFCGAPAGSEVGRGIARVRCTPGGNKTDSPQRQSEGNHRAPTLTKVMSEERATRLTGCPVIWRASLRAHDYVSGGADWTATSQCSPAREL